MSLIDEDKLLKHLDKLEEDNSLPHMMFNNGKDWAVQQIREGVKSGKYVISYHDIDEFYKD